MKISNKSELDAAIIALEKQRVVQQVVLTTHFKAVRESLSPVNLIKNTFRKLTEGPDFKEGLLKTVAGFGVGVLSKKLFLGGAPGIIRKFLGPVLELTVAKTAVTNADKIKAYGLSIYHNLFKKKKGHKIINDPAGDNRDNL